VATVSVIMPAYNVAPYVGDAVESALAQTFRDLEVLVVDDGSIDATAAIVAAIAARDPRVKLIRQANGGISTARNRALAASTGRYLALLDSDDLWDPEYLAAQLAILESQPEVAVVTGNARFLGSRLDGQPARPWPDARPVPDLASILADEESIFIMSIFRREVYERIGGFDESMRTNEDYDYWLRAAIAGFRFVRNDRPLGRYRRRDDSLSAVEERMVRGILRVYRKTAPMLADRPAERRILERQVDRFEVQLLRIEIGAAIAASDVARAAERLDLLYARRPDLAVGVARLMAHWTPGLLARAYRVRRQRREIRLARPQLT
jgi:glycosyltransferase involved in cell wall biosynthesis